MNKNSHLKKTLKTNELYSLKEKSVSLSRVQLFVYLGTVSCQAPLSKDSPGKNTAAGDYSLLQGIFQNQGLNQGVLHCRRILTVLTPRKFHSGGNRLVDTGNGSPISAQEAFARVGTHSLGVGEETGRAIMGTTRCSAVLGSISVQAWKVRGLDGGFSGGAGICGW